jgi:flagellar hook protein FlgE
MYTVSLNSGAGAIGWPGNGGKGTLAVGYNEGSNVDLGREFTSMILAQRGFQAASRMITTSDEMLQELVNLKR